MDLFPKTLKLYHFFEKKEVSLSLKASQNHVVTFWMSAEKFQHLLQESYKKGYSENRYFVLVKENYVRFSKSLDGAAHHFRIETDKWSTLVKEYNAKIDKPTGEHFSCEID